MKETKQKATEKEMIAYIEKLTKENENLKQYYSKKDRAEQLTLSGVRNCYTEKDMDGAYDKGFNDGNQRDFTI